MNGGIALSAIWKYSYGLYYIAVGSGLLVIGALLACKALAYTRKSRANSALDKVCAMEKTMGGQEETQILDDSEQETLLLDEETILLERGGEESTQLL